MLLLLHSVRHFSYMTLRSGSLKTKFPRLMIVGHNIIYFYSPGISKQADQKIQQLLNVFIKSGSYDLNSRECCNPEFRTVAKKLCSELFSGRIQTNYLLKTLKYNDFISSVKEASVWKYRL